MEYKKFILQNYRAIVDPIEIDLSHGIVPLVGVNECGKTTILQAIFCFDYSNDKINSGRHLKNIMNLYETVDKGTCTIIALIEFDKEVIKSEFNYIIRKKEDEIIALKDKITSINSEIEQLSTEERDERSNEKAVIENQIKELEDTKKKIDKSITDYLEEYSKTKKVIVEISRELYNEADSTIKSVYKSSIFDSEFIDSNTIDKICRKLIDMCPYILYNDDFNDKPYDELVIGGNENTDWQDIYRRVFSSTDKLKENAYNLDDVFDLPENRQNTILSVTSNYLSKILTKAWKELTLKKEEINVSLTMEKRKHSVKTEDGNVVDVIDKVLKIKIREMNKNGYSCQFDLTDRSKGFIWYYNFIMKIQFNPKQIEDSENTVFLLDEPGSYLHETAQKELCNDLRKISMREGSVIYCTHSPQLLIPEIIPPNKIKIVSKVEGIIHASNLTEYKTEGKKIAALQPVYEALGTPMFNTFQNKENIVCVEGIYDKYAIELFCSLPKDTIVFPSVNSDTIINNIAYFITYRIPYLALWDNDGAGNKDCKKAKKHYGEVEGENCFVLPNKGKKLEMKMEDMFEKEDFDTFSEMLGFATKEIYDKNDYQNIMNALYFETTKKVKGELFSKLSINSQHQFSQLNSLISNHFRKKSKKCEKVLLGV